MRLFFVATECGLGLGRPAQPGETLGDFVRASCRPGGWAREMVYWEEPQDVVLSPRRWTAEELARFQAESYGPEDPECLAPEVPLAGYSDDHHVLCWIEVEVPDETRFLFRGGCWATTVGYCGIGGEGFVRILGV